MKNQKLLIACFGLLALFACTMPDKAQGIQFTKVFVESGRIEKDLFVTNGAFKASDATLGRIDSTDQTKNGFLGSDEFAYVFEGGKIPEKIAALDPKTLAQKLGSADWAKDISYKLDKDAFICERHPMFYVREAGEYPRELASIEGEKVYRILNRYVIEDYGNLMDYIYDFHTDKNPVNIFAALGISPTTHTVSTSRADLFVDASTGYINYATSAKTALNTQDKLIFRPKAGGKTYRLRFVLTTYTEKTKTTFFDKNGIIPTSLRPNWKQFLRENKMPQYTESVINGFNCGSGLKMLSNKLDSGPPPPEF
jgi:hypothetical protein